MAPHIPMKMAGGRPLPGYARSASSAMSNASIYRFGSPSPRPTTPHRLLSERDYPFTFNVPMLPAMDVDGMVSPSPRQKDGINDANNAGQTPTEMRELLYGAVSFSNRGSLLYTPTERMNNWLAAQGPSGSAATTTSQEMWTAQTHLSVVQETEIAEPASPLPPTYEEVKKLAGTKHSMDPEETGETQSKRSRLSENVHRRLSRASEISSGVAAEVVSRLSFFSLGAGTNQAAERSIKICLVGDCGSGKTSFINRVLSDEYIPGEPSAVADYRVVTTVGEHEVVKVQLWDFPGTIVGQKQSQLMSHFFDAAIICYSIEDQANMASVATNVRLSTCATRLTKELESRGSLGKEFNSRLGNSVTAWLTRLKWKPQLDRSLAVYCRPVFVLGMKKDLRLDFPTLGLSFLDEDDSDVASQRDGKAVAKSVGASGFGECSARTGENIAPVFKAIVNFVVANVKANEAKMAQSRREGKINNAVRDTKAGFKKVGKAFSKLKSKFRK